MVIVLANLQVQSYYGHNPDECEYTAEMLKSANQLVEVGVRHVLFWVMGETPGTSEPYVTLYTVSKQGSKNRRICQTAIVESTIKAQNELR